jgi:hypothetical protein
MRQSVVGPDADPALSEHIRSIPALKGGGDPWGLTTVPKVAAVKDT